MKQITEITKCICLEDQIYLLENYEVPRQMPQLSNAINIYSNMQISPCGAQQADATVSHLELKWLTYTIYNNSKSYRLA